jgi:hypothetical protein
MYSMARVLLVMELMLSRNIPVPVPDLSAVESGMEGHQSGAQL